MKRVINIFLFSISLLLLSCNEEWLKPEPLSFYAPENVYVNENGFKALLTTMRKDLKRECYEDQNFFQMEFASSDLAVPRDQCDWAVLTPSGSRFKYLTMFTSVYVLIKNANVAISRIDDIKWDDQQVRNSVLAEALFYRSYWYYRLLHSYGDIPWVGEEIKGAKLDFYTYSRWAILKKIQSDMEFAVQWLPAQAAIGFATKYAGFHLLTKIYLSNTEFDKAIESASNIIDGPFALMKDRFGSWKNDNKRNVLWDLHRVENKSLPENTETILATIDRYDAPPGAKVATGTYVSRNFTAHWWAIPDQTGARGYDWKLVMGDSVGQGNHDATANYFASHGLWSEFGYNWETTPDLRRSDINWLEMEELIFNNPKSVNFGQPPSKAYFADKTDTSYMWRSMPFYKTFMPREFGYPEGRPRGGNGDWYIYRLAETYLLRAEAYFWKNQLDLAAEDINMIRERANAVPITANDVTVDLIFHERARELYTEEPRHSEMVRVANIMAKLNIDGYKLENIHENNWFYDRVMRFNNWYSEPRFTVLGGPKAKIYPYNIYWPIPQSVITANTLGKVNQNIGYQGADSNIPPIEIIE